MHYGHENPGPPAPPSHETIHPEPDRECADDGRSYPLCSLAYRRRHAASRESPDCLDYTPRDDRHGQAGVLPCSGSRSGSFEPSPTRRHTRKQPRGKLPPRHSTTRTEAAEVQVPELSPEGPRQPRRRLQHLQHPAATGLPTRTANPASPGPRGVDRRHRSGLKMRGQRAARSRSQLTGQYPRLRLGQCVATCVSPAGRTPKLSRRRSAGGRSCRPAASPGRGRSRRW